MRWQVEPYSPDALRSLLAKRSGAPAAVIGSKLHCTYFDNYFDELKAKTVLIESDYIDRDYLEDFAAYYARCFHPYERKCTRAHFFASEFTSNQFAQFVEAPTDIQAKDFQTHYLGFIVIRPLPKAVIGRTCLKTYPHAGRRYYPITRKYDANIFGLQLTVDSLAFQEQDREAAACATSALWSTFQGTGIRFQHHIPSPIEITQLAMKHTHFNLRQFPQEGLTEDQMGHAIHQVGLEPTLINATDETTLTDTTYSYVKGHIPLLLLGALQDHSDPAKPSELGYHAVVVTGYSLGRACQPQGTTKFLSTSSRIDKIYCHDDQVGPFARMEYDGLFPRGSLSTSWVGSNGQIGSIRLVPTQLIIPLYHKIRLPFDAVQDDIIEFDALLSWIRQRQKPGHVALPLPLEWDIFLTSINELKTELFHDAGMGPQRRGLLEMEMPRFIWRAKGLFGDRVILEILFDATDIQHGGRCFKVVVRDAALGDCIRGMVLDPAARSFLETKNFWRILKHF